MFDVWDWLATTEEMQIFKTMYQTPWLCELTPHGMGQELSDLREFEACRAPVCAYPVDQPLPCYRVLLFPAPYIQALYKIGPAQKNVLY